MDDPVKLEVKLRNEHAVSNGLSVDKVTKAAALVSALCIASVGTCTLGETIKKFSAETERALLEAQRIRIEVAAKASDSGITLQATKLLGKGNGWYTVTANLRFTNAGVQTVLVDHVRFACASTPLENAWETGLGLDASVATWVNTPVSPGGLAWSPLGPAVSYPMGGRFMGNHASNFVSQPNDGGITLRDTGDRYQPNGAGIYMSGEVVQASHQVVARFARAAAVGCTAELEYRITNSARTELQGDAAIFSDAGGYIFTDVATTFPVCGFEDWDACNGDARSTPAAF